MDGRVTAPSDAAGRVDEHTDEHAGEHTVGPAVGDALPPPGGAPAYVAAGDKARVLQRLRRVEGQVRGLQRMVEQDTYCIDVLTQVSATTAALRAVALQLLEEHLQHCVRHAVEDGDQADARIAEASAAVARLVRS